LSFVLLKVSQAVELEDHIGLEFLLGKPENLSFNLSFFPPFFLQGLAILSRLLPHYFESAEVTGVHYHPR
jgi:hypothetical protein